MQALVERRLPMTAAAGIFTLIGTNGAGMAVLQSAANAVVDRFSGETVLEIPALTESSAGLVKKLLPASQSTGLMRAVLDLTR